METEKKDWKPEVGKTCWFVYNDNVWEVLVEKVNDHSQTFIGKGFGWNEFRYLFPTAEAALASIKVYDLDGKEVVVTRAEPVFTEPVLDGKATSWWTLDERGWTHPTLRDRDEKTWEEVVRAYSEMKYNGMSYNEFLKFMDTQLEAAKRIESYDREMFLRVQSLAAGNEDPADPSARELTTPTDKRNGDHC